MRTFWSTAAGSTFPISYLATRVPKRGSFIPSYYFHRGWLTCLELIGPSLEKVYPSRGGSSSTRVRSHVKRNEVRTGLMSSNSPFSQKNQPKIFFSQKKIHHEYCCLADSS